MLVLKLPSGLSGWGAQGRKAHAHMNGEDWTTESYNDGTNVENACTEIEAERPVARITIAEMEVANTLDVYRRDVKNTTPRNAIHQRTRLENSIQVRTTIPCERAVGKQETSNENRC